MQSWSPTAEGFRLIFGRPVLSLAEIVWRWSFAAAAWLLGTLALFEYLDTLPVSNRDVILLRSGVPGLIGRGLTHALRGSGERFLLAAVAVSIGLAILWIAIASLGRAATLLSILGTIQARVRCTFGLVSKPDVDPQVTSPCLRSLAGLHLLRVMLFSVTALAGVGAAFAAGLLSPAADPNPGVAFLAFLFLAFAIVVVAVGLNWVLSLATLFVVRDAQDAFGAVDAALKLCRDRFGAVFAVGTWFGFAHFTFFVVAMSVVMFPLSLAAIVPPAFVLLGMLVITLVYLAIADSLYIGRLAGYAAIVEAPIGRAAVASVGATVPVAWQYSEPGATSRVTGVEADASAAVDQDELILSDGALNNLAADASETEGPSRP